MKKIFLVFLSVILAFSLIMPPERAQAAVVSKVVQKAVFKVVKEAAKDEALNQTMNMVINYKYVPKEEREKIKKPDAGFSMICLPENRKNDICEKPMQVKSSYTKDDIKALGNKVEEKLNNKTGNKGFMKIVNWFVPVWIVGAAFTISDLLVDGEISSFFADLGYEALVSLGFIKPLGKDVAKTDVPIVPFDPSIDPDSPDKDKTMPGGAVPVYLGTNSTVPKIPSGIYMSMDANTNFTKFTGNTAYGVSEHFFAFKSDRPYLYGTGTTNVFNYKYVLLVFEMKGYDLSKFYPTKSVSKLVVYRTDYPSTSYSTRGKIAEIDLTSEHVYLNRTHSYGLRQDEINHYMNLASKYFFEDLVETQPEPLPEIKPQGVPVITPGTVVKVPSPNAVPTKDTTTGKTVRPKPGSTPDAPIWIDTDGNVVPEENITVGDLIIEETPKGNIIKNPDPEGIPNMQDGITPLPNQPPPPTDDITEEDFEKLSCARLKKPDFKPLSNAITTSFPFSIPWDLHRAFSSAFSQIGNERPNFAYDFSFNGKQYEWDIGFPKMFDDWIPFTRGLLLLGFDIGLVYAIYRFTKGGGD